MGITASSGSHADNPAAGQQKTDKKENDEEKQNGRSGKKRHVIADAYPWFVAFTVPTLLVTAFVLGLTVPASQQLMPELLLLIALATSEAVWISRQRPDEDNLIPDNEEARMGDVLSLLRFFSAAIIFGLYLLVRLAWTNAGPDYLRVLAALLAWGAGTLTIGALLGFLFGIPRTLAGSSADRAHEAQKASGSEAPANYRVNTNLERISDWLTQIIVGGTVTQLALLPDHLRRLANFYTQSVGVPVTVPWRLAGVGSTLYFLIVGFLGSYLITRLYLARAIQRADDSGISQVAKLSNLTEVEMDALEAAPLAYAGENSEFKGIAKSAAEKITRIPLDRLTDWRDLRVWAKAWLKNGDAQKAAGGYARVIALNPHDAESRLGYGVALGLTDNPKAAVLTQLEHARASLMLSTPRDVRKNVYKSLTYTTLYLQKPESFRKSLNYAREYYSRVDTVGPDATALDSAGILFNVACAYGQAYRWLAEDPSRTLTRAELAWRNDMPGAGDTQPVKGDVLQPVLEQDVLSLLRRVLSRDIEYAEKLQKMLSEPYQDDDDFQPFADKQPFKELLADALKRHEAAKQAARRQKE